MTSFARRALVLGLAAAVLLFGLLFFDPRVLADRSMRAPDDACPHLEIGPRQCAAIVAVALDAAGIRPSDVITLSMGRPDGPNIQLGGALVAVVRATTRDGHDHEEEVWCTGVGSHERAWCNEDPPLHLWMGANHDTPACADGDGVCVTPIALDPAAVAAARSLEVARLDIPLTPGRYDIELGRALLPNGYLDEARFALADPAPDGVEIPDGVRLEVEPVDPDRPPLGNVYERGTVPGVEEVIVRLRFEVIAAPTGSILEIRDVLVR